MTLTPAYTTPADLAAHLGASKRGVEDKVRELGCYAKLGARVIMLEHHVEFLLEAMQCHSQSTSAGKPGTTGAPLPEGDYAVLVEQRTKKSPKGSRRKKKPLRGNVISMGRGQM